MGIGRPSSGGHIRRFPRHNTSYRLISVAVDGIRRQRFEHRLVMEQFLGRRLRRGEIVHHLDGDGLNNSIDNLSLITQAEHVDIHRLGLLSWSLDAAVCLRGEGCSFAEIGSIVGVCAASIQAAFKRRGIDTGGRPIIYTWDFNLAVQLFRDGVSIRDIAKTVGTGSSTIKRSFRRRGIAS